MNNSMARTTDMPTSEHRRWCDPAECINGELVASHYGAAVGVQIDTSDCLPWRCEPEGTAEIVVRPARLDGHPAVEIQHDPVGNVQSTSGSVGVSWLKPAEARALAALLLELADEVER